MQAECETQRFEKPPLYPVSLSCPDSLLLLENFLLKQQETLGNCPGLLQTGSMIFLFVTRMASPTVPRNINCQLHTEGSAIQEMSISRCPCMMRMAALNRGRRACPQSPPQEAGPGRKECPCGLGQKVLTLSSSHHPVCVITAAGSKIDVLGRGPLKVLKWGFTCRAEICLQ